MVQGKGKGKTSFAERLLGHRFSKAKFSMFWMETQAVLSQDVGDKGGNGCFDSSVREFTAGWLSYWGPELRQDASEVERTECGGLFTS